ncbi:Ig-like domain-containing protein [Thermococcus celer]|nr:hypothetical protein [Thermococcus celer]
MVSRVGIGKSHAGERKDKPLKRYFSLVLIMLLIIASGCLSGHHPNPTTSTITQQATETRQRDTAPPEVILESVSKNPDNGSITIKLAIRDDSTVKTARLTYDNVNLTLNKTGEYYKTTLKLENPDEAKEAWLKVTATDEYNNTAQKTIRIEWSLRDAYVYFLNENNLDDNFFLEFFNQSEGLRHMFDVSKNLTREILLVANKSSKNLEDNIAFLALNYTETSREARLYFNILSSTGTYNAKPEVVRALYYYVKAVTGQDLPLHDYAILKTFINASDENPELIDFQPIVLHDNYRHWIKIYWYNKPRDTWMIVEFIRRNPYVVENENLYLPVNMLIKETAWNFFDNKFGPRYADKHHNNLTEKQLDAIYNPESEDVWYVIQKLWDYYYQGINKRYQYIKWWDKEEFAKQYPDITERKLILLGLWDVPNQVPDLSHTHKDERNNDVYNVVWGMEAQRRLVDELEEMYKILDNASKTNEGRWQYLLAWYQWIVDRGHNGLPNMHEQFVGAKVGEIKIALRVQFERWTEQQKEDWYNDIMNHNGVDQFLTKIFPDYEKVKAAYGYVRYNGGDFGGEIGTYYYGLNLAFKAYGIPTRINSLAINKGRSAYSSIYIYKAPLSTIGGEFIFPLPKNIRDLLKQKYGDGIVFSPEGGFSMYGLKDGLEKDGMLEIGTCFYRITKDVKVIDPEKHKIVLWKKS